MSRDGFWYGSPDMDTAGLKLNSPLKYPMQDLRDRDLAVADLRDRDLAVADLRDRADHRHRDQRRRRKDHK